MQGHNTDNDDDSPLVPFPSILSDSDTQLISLESNIFGTLPPLESSFVQTRSAHRTVTRQGVSPFALLQTATPSFSPNDESIGGQNLSVASLDPPAPSEASATAGTSPSKTKRRKTSDVYRVYGLKHEVSEELWEGDPKAFSNTKMAMKKLRSNFDLAKLELAAYRIREDQLAERVYPCSHPQALSEPTSKRWKKRNPHHVNKFFEGEAVAELLREGVGGVAKLEGTLACASPCWKCTERLQRFVLLNAGAFVAYTDVIGVQASRARKGRSRKATSSSSSTSTNDGAS